MRKAGFPHNKLKRFSLKGIRLMSVRRIGRAKSGSKLVPSVAVESSVLRRAVDWILNDRMFADLRKHGNVSWNAKPLIILAVFLAWMNCDQLTRAFEKASELSSRLYGELAVRTFQGLVRALVTYSSQLLPMVWARLQSLMESVSPEHYRIGKWLTLAVDGSRFTTPRTKSNEHAFAARNFGKGKDARSRCNWKNKRKRTKKLGVPVKPQIWLTLIWHMGLKLPWCWQTGPSTSSERHQFLGLLDSGNFPKNTLFCADAGFVGYALWAKIIEQGQAFLVRVGGNVRLLKNLGHICRGEGIVCLWPTASARRGDQPIVLRLIEVKGERESMFLVTNVLSESALSTATLKRIYPLRWGVELQFHAMKQTFGRGKLRSRNAQHALIELDWSLVALTMVQLLAIKEQLKLNIPPDKTSVARALRAIRDAIDNWNESSGTSPCLTRELRAAIKDAYNRTKPKAARYHPDYKDKPSATRPKVQPATRLQRKAYQALMTSA
jgi:hypothetical protein